MMKTLGVGHHGVSEWYWQRLSAVLLLLLLPWAVALLWALYFEVFTAAEIHHLLEHTMVRIGHSVLLMMLMMHAYLGVKGILEDYVHHVASRMFFLGSLQVLTGVLAVGWLSMIWSV